MRVMVDLGPYPFSIIYEFYLKLNPHKYYRNVSSSRLNRSAGVDAPNFSCTSAWTNIVLFRYFNYRTNNIVSKP
ncbi:hypothetical protein Hanom_Chr07g00589501 [Helianthus anomalus]